VRKVKNHLGSSIEVVPYQPSNWYSEIGAQKKLYQLEKKGLPNFYNWRFVTLTVDPLKFKSEQSAYEHIKTRMRYFIRSLKVYLEINDLRYAWKLEFQENGMPHWHMLIDHKKPIDVKHLTKLWKYGRIDIKRCKDKAFPYTFKYCSKNIEGLPSWFLEYKRPRLFQSSGIFPKSNDPDWSVSEEKGEGEETNPSPSETLGERLKRYQSMVQFKKSGKIFQLFHAGCNWMQSFRMLIKFPHVEFINSFKLIVPYEILTSLTT
jgi:hypothetical protein